MVIRVDSTIPDYLNAVIAIVVFSPVFLVPGIAAFVIGAVVGQI